MFQYKNEPPTIQSVARETEFEQRTKAAILLHSVSVSDSPAGRGSLGVLARLTRRSEAPADPRAADPGPAGPGSAGPRPSRSRRRSRRCRQVRSTGRLGGPVKPGSWTGARDDSPLDLEEKHPGQTIPLQAEPNDRAPRTTSRANPGAASPGFAGAPRLWELGRWRSRTSDRRGDRTFRPGRLGGTRALAAAGLDQTWTPCRRRPSRAHSPVYPAKPGPGDESAPS